MSGGCGPPPSPTPPRPRLLQHPGLITAALGSPSGESRAWPGCGLAMPHLLSAGSPQLHGGQGTPRRPLGCTSRAIDPWGFPPRLAPVPSRGVTTKGEQRPRPVTAAGRCGAHRESTPARDWPGHVAVPQHPLLHRTLRRGDGCPRSCAHVSQERHVCAGASARQRSGGARSQRVSSALGREQFSTPRGDPSLY